MEIVLSFLTVVFVALIIGTALAFGFVILMWVIGVAVLLTVLLFLRETIRRWLFVRHARPETPDVIEGDYKDISE